MLDQPVTAALWAVVQLLVPPVPAGPKRGRPRLAARIAFAGHNYILMKGVPGRFFPKALGLGSASTLNRRLRELQESGV